MPSTDPGGDENRLTIPPALSPPSPYGNAATSTRVIARLAASAPPSASTAVASSPDSTLFSDRPSF
jgi:hypothetical protein